MNKYRYSNTNHPSTGRKSKTENTAGKKNKEDRKPQNRKSEVFTILLKM